MKTLVDQLANYAAYHRERRNIATHFVGIPMIVLAVQVLLARPAWLLGPVPLTPALLLSVAVALYYLSLDRPLGWLMAAWLFLGLLVAEAEASQSTATWLGVGIGLFLLGWVIQFVGHIFEGRKPAFVDDIMGLLIGPLFGRDLSFEPLAIFNRIALAEEGGASKLFAADALAGYGARTGMAVEVPQVQNMLERLIAANLIHRQSHGVYAIADPFVRQAWRQRQADVQCGRCQRGCSEFCRPDRQPGLPRPCRCGAGAAGLPLRGRGPPGPDAQQR